MTDEGGKHPPAGWYADPSGEPGLRWWDGSQWTEHTHAQTDRREVLLPHQTPERALHDEQALARWARILVVAMAFLAPVTAALYLPQLRSMRELFANPAALQAIGDPTLAMEPSPLFTLASSLQTAASLVVLVWLYRAATAAHRLGIPMRRSPAWAVGAWFVPVINLWWPCQAMRDLLPPEHGTRRTITVLWWLYLVALATYLFGFIGVLFGEGRLPEILMLVSASIQACGLLAGRTVIDHVLAAHERQAAVRGVATA